MRNLVALVWMIYAIAWIVDPPKTTTLTDIAALICLGIAVIILMGGKDKKD